MFDTDLKTIPNSASEKYHAETQLTKKQKIVHFGRNQYGNC